MSETERPHSGALQRRLRSLAPHAPDVVLMVALLLLFWCEHRFFEEVEYGGDAIEKWHFVRQWHYANDFKDAHWTHHMARMGVNAITWLVQSLFGTGWRSYYVGPFVMAALQLPFVYLLARRFGGRSAGVVGVLAITFLAMVHRSASQLLPDGYAGTCAIGLCYLVVRYAEAPDTSRRPWLLSAALVAFFGYLTKETFAFFFPGLALAIWLVRRRMGDVLWVFGLLLAGFLLESAAYSLFTGFSSRLAIVRGTHFAGSEEEPSNGLSFMDLFQRFHELHDATKYLLFFGVAAALWLAVLRKDEAPARARAIALMGLSYIFFLTFTVKSLRPLDVLQGFDPRYMEPVTPFLGVYCGVFLVSVGKGLVAGAPWSTRLRPLAHADAWGSALLLVLVGAVGFVTWAGQRRTPPLSAFARGEEIAGLLNRAYQRNLPLLERSNRPKVLTAAYSVYLDDRQLAKQGVLPSFSDVKHVQRGTTFLIKDRAAYGKNTLAKLMEEGCYIELDRGRARNPRTRDRRSSIEIKAPATDPPARCDELVRPRR